MNQSIILIEDDQWLADSYQAMLIAKGYEVTQLSTASEAMVAIDKKLPALIIADIMLGDQNSFSLFHELQSYPDTARVPVIVCTSLSLHKLSTSDLRSYGVVKVLDKATLTPDQLIVEVASYLPETRRNER